MMRSATSPRFAIRIFLNIGLRQRSVRLYADVTSRVRLKPDATRSVSSRRPNREQPLAVLDRLSVLDVDLHDLAFVLGVDLVHQLHRFDDAEDLTLFYRRSDLEERRRAGLGRSIEIG